MGIISAILALFRAVPSLERLFFKISDEVREVKAKERLNAKLTHIDNAIRTTRGGLLHTEENEWSEGIDRSPTISDSGEGSTSFHEGSVEKSS